MGTGARGNPSNRHDRYSLHLPTSVAYAAIRSPNYGSAGALNVNLGAFLR